MNEIQALKSGLTYVLDTATRRHMSSDMMAHMLRAVRNTAQAGRDWMDPEMSDDLVVALTNLDKQIEEVVYSTNRFKAMESIQEIVATL